MGKPFGLSKPPPPDSRGVFHAGSVPQVERESARAEKTPKIRELVTAKDGNIVPTTGSGACEPNAKGKKHVALGHQLERVWVLLNRHSRLRPTRWADCRKLELGSDMPSGACPQRKAIWM